MRSVLRQAGMLSGGSADVGKRSVKDHTWISEPGGRPKGGRQGKGGQKGKGSARREHRVNNASKRGKKKRGKRKKGQKRRPKRRTDAPASDRPAAASAVRKFHTVVAISSALHHGGGGDVLRRPAAGGRVASRLLVDMEADRRARWQQLPRPQARRRRAESTPRADGGGRTGRRAGGAHAVWMGHPLRRR